MRWITIITLHAQYADWIFSKLNWWDEILIFTTTLQIYEVLICLVLHHPLHCLHHFDFTCLNFWFNNNKRISLQISLYFFLNAWSEPAKIFLRTLIWTCRHQMWDIVARAAPLLVLVQRTVASGLVPHSRNGELGYELPSTHLYYVTWLNK